MICFLSLPLKSFDRRWISFTGVNPTSRKYRGPWNYKNPLELHERQTVCRGKCQLSDQLRLTGCTYYRKVGQVVQRFVWYPMTVLTSFDLIRHLRSQTPESLFYTNGSLETQDSEQTSTTLAPPTGCYVRRFVVYYDTTSDTFGLKTFLS